VPAPLAGTNRFRLDGGNFDRLLSEYDRLRASRGLGLAENSATPTQRIDAAQILLELYWAGVTTPEAAHDRAFWLSYLKPVLAETREAGAALADAFKALEPEKAREVADARRFSWRRFLLAASFLLATAAIFLLWPSSPPPTVDATPVLSSDPVQKAAVGGDTPYDDAKLRRLYDETLAVVRQQVLSRRVLTKGRDLVTPRVLAAEGAKLYSEAGKAPIILSQMLREAPLDPDRPITQENGGPDALRRYVAVVAAARMGLSPRLFDSILSSVSVDDLVLPDDHSVAAGTVAVRNATPAWPDWLRWLSFLPMGPALVWALRGRDKMIADSERKAREDFSPRRAQRNDIGERGEIAIAAGDLPPAPDLFGAARRLLRLRDPVPGCRLDATRSVRETLDAPGDLVIRYRPASVAAELVFLLLRDHERARVVRFVDRLRRQGVAATLYDYAPDPRRPATPAGAPLDQRGLRERHPRATLILCTSGEELVDFFSQEPNPQILHELRQWPRLALLTPTPTEEWGEREMRLASALDASVLRSTEEGFGELAAALDPMRGAAAQRSRLHAAAAGGLLQQIEAWRGPVAGPDLIDARPAILRRDWPTLLLNHAPDKDFRSELVDALRAWLDPLGYFWLAVCGVYPRVSVDITLWLGAHLHPYGLAAARPVFSEERFARLCLLPWFAHGFMPDWLRRDAFASLTPQEKTEAREKMEALLNANTGGATRNEETWLPGGVEAVPPDGVMLDCLGKEGETDEPTVSFAQTLKDARAAAERGYAYRAIGRTLLAALACAGAYLFWPNHAAAPLAKGAWLPLMTYVAGWAGLLGLAMIAKMRSAQGGA
jgi:hypothetical protein